MDFRNESYNQVIGLTQKNVSLFSWAAMRPKQIFWNGEETVKKFFEETVKLYIALMFTFLPLYYSDNYYNILHDKRDGYLLFSAGMLTVLAAAGLVWLTGGLLKKKSSVREILKTEYQSICLLDGVIVTFALVALLSSKLSGDFPLSYYGEAAWDVGSRVIILSTLVYFAVSRGFSRREDVWFYVYIGSFAVLLIGVIDRLGYDFLVMHDEIPLQYNIFISTVGNVNFWAAYLSMLVPFFALVPVFLKNRGRRLWVYLFLFTAYLSCFITLTNTTYIGIGSGMLYVVYYSLQKKDRLKNLSVNMVLFAAAGLAADILRAGNFTPRPIDTDEITLFLLQYKLYAAVGALGAFLFFFCIRSKGEQEKICKLLRRIWIGVILSGILGAAVYTALNFSLEIYNYRGSIWYFSWKGYLDGSVKDWLLGAGPGLLDNVTQRQIQFVREAGLEAVWDFLYNTAHNDLLEYLVTTGAVGFVLKVLSCVLPFVMMNKNTEHPVERAAVLAALAGYMGQGLVTGPYLLTYVLYMIFVAMYVRYWRN